MNVRKGGGTENKMKERERGKGGGVIDERKERVVGG